MVSTSAAAAAAEPSTTMKRTMKRPPNWQEMPHDLMANILQRLSTVDILKNAKKVCTTWRKICKDPAIWKAIDVEAWDACYTNCDLEKLTKKAIDLSCGELIDFSIDAFGSIDLLNYLFLRSSKFNRLCLIYCKGITGSWLSGAVKRLPQLEKLHLSHINLTVKDIEIIGQNCPQLNSFAMNQEFQEPHNDDYALEIANNMTELRHLQVIGNNMTNNGLEGILEGCPHLESLDVRMCYNLDLDGNLETLCMERIEDFKRPNDSIENCGFYHISYDYNEFDDRNISGASDVDEPFEIDFYEDDNFFWRHQHF